MKIFVVIDVQNDFIYGTLGTSEAQAIIPIMERKLKNLGDNDFVIFTQDTHYDNYLKTQEGINLPIEHCIEGSEGHKIVSAIFNAPKCETETILKSTFGSYELCSLIGKFISYGCSIDEIVLMGVCTDICVISNALLLKSCFPGVKLVVDTECCAGTTPERQAAAIEVMKSCQIYEV